MFQHLCLFVITLFSLLGAGNASNQGHDGVPAQPPLEFTTPLGVNVPTAEVQGQYQRLYFVSAINPEAHAFLELEGRELRISGGEARILVFRDRCVMYPNFFDDPPMPEPCSHLEGHPEEKTTHIFRTIQMPQASSPTRSLKRRNPGPSALGSKKERQIRGLALLKEDDEEENFSTSRDGPLPPVQHAASTSSSSSSSSILSRPDRKKREDEERKGHEEEESSSLGEGGQLMTQEFERLELPTSRKRFKKSSDQEGTKVHIRDFKKRRHTPEGSSSESDDHGLIDDGSAQLEEEQFNVPMKVKKLNEVTRKSQPSEEDITSPSLQYDEHNDEATKQVLLDTSDKLDSPGSHHQASPPTPPRRSHAHFVASNSNRGSEDEQDEESSSKDLSEKKDSREDDEINRGARRFGGQPGALGDSTKRAHTDDEGEKRRNPSTRSSSSDVEEHVGQMAITGVNQANSPGSNGDGEDGYESEDGQYYHEHGEMPYWGRMVTLKEEVQEGKDRLSPKLGAADSQVHEQHEHQLPMSSTLFSSQDKEETGEEWDPSEDKQYGDEEGQYGDEAAQHGDYGDDEDQYGDDEDQYGDDEDQYGDDEDQYGDDEDQYGDDEDQYGDDGDQYGDEDDQYGDEDDQYGEEEDDQYGEEEDDQHGELDVARRNFRLQVHRNRFMLEYSEILGSETVVVRPTDIVLVILRMIPQEPLNVRLAALSEDIFENVVDGASLTQLMVDEALKLLQRAEAHAFLVGFKVPMALTPTVSEVQTPSRLDDGVSPLQILQAFQFYPTELDQSTHASLFKVAPGHLSYGKGPNQGIWASFHMSSKSTRTAQISFSRGAVVVLIRDGQAAELGEDRVAVLKDHTETFAFKVEDSHVPMSEDDDHDTVISKETAAPWCITDPILLDEKAPLRVYPDVRLRHDDLVLLLVPTRSSLGEEKPAKVIDIAGSLFGTDASSIIETLEQALVAFGQCTVAMAAQITIVDLEQEHDGSTTMQ